MKSYRPVALIILDGWGIREMEHGNAVVQAHTPNYDRWMRSGERSVVDASGEAVGLPEGQMGNSEVGHLNLGAGRIIYQDLTRINLSIDRGEFFGNPVLTETMEAVKARGGKLHLIGLLGNGGVHSHSKHMYALLQAAEKNKLVPIIHVITDGRDTPPESALGFARTLEAYLAEGHPGIIASVVGRYYIMDRDKRWPRTELGYRDVVYHEGYHEGDEPMRVAPSLSAALEDSYRDGITDEFVWPVAIDPVDAEPGVPPMDLRVEPGDALIFFNFRADRMRQIITAFTKPAEESFPHEHIPNLDIVTMTNYDPAYPVKVLFPDVDITNPLAEVISDHGLKQFHAAETEKYAHVTYFFNGGVETPFPGEERHLEPSPKVATYDLQPEMSARPLAEAVIKRVQTGDDDFILVNFANPDMVGHTGVLSAAVKAVETVDECAGRLVEAINAKGGVAIVTADHGNCERMIDELTGEPHTYHTTQPVSLFVLGDQYYNLKPRGILADVTPTILHLMGIPQPAEMTGSSLIDQ
ncbi:MAG: 2,3-bisphosphoglycerate-independent phosphoglycerate mutase [Anaerolineales bacterium]|uniref:2,3-bisphosphoglycerate-independent phosphoglycerate mutase n=1 Tax=Promineifilum sp. TaxID=2664178 RepID=UPI001D5B9215|nr:2,3-bisphosphoglycerate-independent phosphoglycerate mutase [Anaerolineales bacterium]MCB8934977.1 2,3-bisphosphoglycerate-independent phosphoglycerate mutase [Promineifilum sp.]MCO5178421.1 2,3-bisphosphoglycerate-independent phosphoglycerate mutase [Promineifilum sp.]